MSKVYIHLSDIHFGQEKKGGEVVVHNDAKARLLDDVTAEVKKLKDGKADGIIVTGDIAYAGKPPEYTDAGKWLDKIAKAVGCEITDIQVVPGNHDIDLEKISPATRLMLAGIIADGEDALDTFLDSLQDRELLYARFHAYRSFAEAYDCSMDCAGGFASTKIVSLAPNRTLQFVGLNSALICAGKGDKKGSLLLGAKQRVLPKVAGQELVVLSHHPLSWLRDSEDARRYVRNRARVFVSGHEHKPDIFVDPVSEGQDLMMLAAGATVPPAVNEIYTYTYNIIEFDWDQGSNRLKVTINPRAWEDELKEFRADSVRLGGKNLEFFLGCPNFRLGEPANEQQGTVVIPSTPADLMMPSDDGPEARHPPAQNYRLTLLRFFRDLSGTERLAILIKLGGLPTNWDETLTQSIERRALDGLSKNGRLSDIDGLIDETIKNRSSGAK